jgi:hypothetical protein
MLGFTGSTNSVTGDMGSASLVTGGRPGRNNVRFDAQFKRIKRENRREKHKNSGIVESVHYHTASEPVAQSNVPQKQCKRHLNCDDK